MRFTRAARRDLLDLWLYIAASDEGAADRVFDRLRSRCDRLKDHPESGRARPDIGKGARSLVVDRWIVLYRVRDRDILIVRIVDGVRDLLRLDWSKEPR